MEFTKLQLDSKRDYEHIKNIIKKELDAQLKGQKSDKKSEKIVSSLLKKWDERVFEHLNSNILINGIDCEKALIIKEEYDLIDDSLLKEVQNLQMKYDDLKLDFVNNRKFFMEKFDFIYTDTVSKNPVSSLNFNVIDFEDSAERDLTIPKIDQESLEHFDENIGILNKLIKEVPTTNNNFKELVNFMEKIKAQNANKKRKLNDKLTKNKKSSSDFKLLQQIKRKKHSFI